MNQRVLPGAANDLVPLTNAGVKQAEHAASLLKNTAATQILSSPMTRALQTAAVISRSLDLPISVEFDLREWVVDDTYRWIGAPPRSVIDEFIGADGEWPDGEPQPWEPLSAVRDRVLAVLRRTTGPDQNHIVVVHAVVIHAVTGVASTPLGAIRAVDDLE